MESIQTTGSTTIIRWFALCVLFCSQREEIDVMLQEDPGAKALVFSQYTSMLDLIAYRMHQVGAKANRPCAYKPRASSLRSGQTICIIEYMPRLFLSPVGIGWTINSLDGKVSRAVAVSCRSPRWASAA